jgi:xanthine dehydrogenase accessory factor
MLDVAQPDEIERFAQAGASVLVTVAHAKGSTPRVEGTQMLVSATQVLGTIGGGQLEYMAIDAARQMIASAEDEKTLAIPLGPEIGQCCGGHVTLALKRIAQASVASLVDKARKALDIQPHVLIFGAGHVGRALAKAMLPLPVNARLIDNRQTELELADPTVSLTATVLPESLIRDAPPGAAYILVTHDHALDFLLAREALSRRDAAYVGMIGSKTKRATFARWLDGETGSREGMERLTMPIGTSKLSDKRPAVIAAMVAAQVMEAVGVYQREKSAAAQVSA